MGISGEAERTNQLKLYAWEDGADLYNHTQLYNNWTTIDGALLKKKWGATANYAYGDYAEDVKFAGTSGLGTSVISIRSGTVTSGTLSVADNHDRINIVTGGTVNWSSGSTVVDVSLYRSGTAILATSGTFDATNFRLTDGAGKYSQQAATSASTIFVNSKVSADTNDRFSLTAAGSVSWGSGTSAADTNLYRAGAGTITTDSVFSVGTVSAKTNGGTVTFADKVNFTSNFTSSGTAMGFFGSASTQAVGWGTGPSNLGTAKTYNADSVSLTELADTVGNIIVALRSYGILGA